MDEKRSILASSLKRVNMELVSVFPCLPIGEIGVGYPCGDARGTAIGGWAREEVCAVAQREGCKNNVKLGLYTIRTPSR